MVGRGASLYGRLSPGGTDGSNPVPSSGESTANLTFGGHLSPTSIPTMVRPLALLMLVLTVLAQFLGAPQDEHVFWAALFGRCATAIDALRAGLDRCAAGAPPGRADLHILEILPERLQCLRKTDGPAFFRPSLANAELRLPNITGRGAPNRDAPRQGPPRGTGLTGTRRLPSKRLRPLHAPPWPSAHYRWLS
jgi:hypothetical protein